MNISYKYKSAKIYSILYAVLLCVGFLLTVGRWASVFLMDFVIINPEIHSHISNVSLSLIVYLGIGYTWLLLGVKFRFIVLFGMLMIAGNFLCETLMGFMNTADMLDAFYGAIGITIVFVFLVITNKYGLIPINERAYGDGNV